MLNATSEYAIRAIGYLATVEPGENIGSTEIADATNVPKRFLLKILNMLKNQGVISTTRGIGGGFCLARKPEDITLMEIVTVFEDISRHAHCLLGHDICDPKDPCPLHIEWRKILDQIESFLQNTSVACFRDARDKHIFGVIPKTAME